MTEDLNRYGCAVLPKLITPEECGELVSLYAKDEPFRSKVVMARHGFGRGEYKYFGYPLPPLIQKLRTHLYRLMLPVANDWSRAPFPATHCRWRAFFRNRAVISRAGSL